MANATAPMEEDQKMSTEVIEQEAPEQNQVDLREISITLDSWSRTCDTVLNTLSDQITKIIKNNSNAKT